MKHRHHHDCCTRYHGHTGQPRLSSNCPFVQARNPTGRKGDESRNRLTKRHMEYCEYRHII